MATLICRSKTHERGSLWQGSADDVVRAGGAYDLIVLCAEEFQPEASLIVRSPVRVLYAPNDDGERPLTAAQIKGAIRAAKEVARAFSAGQRVLVSCFMGRNRSGFVMALALHLLYGMSGDQARSLIREKVPYALSNDDFNRFLAKVQLTRSQVLS